MISMQTITDSVQMVIFHFQLSEADRRNLTIAQTQSDFL